MKVIAINGSAHKEGNTYHGLNIVANELRNENIEVEIVQIGHKGIRGCIACNQCAKNQDEKCVLPDDGVNELIQKMKEADGILLGSPVHYSALGASMKSFLDRAFYVAGMNGGLFRHKVGASLAAVRRSGGLPTFNQLNNFLNYAEILMPTSCYWNVIHGTKPGDALQDAEGVQIMRVLGKNMAWTMKMVDATKDSIPKPEAEKKAWTNFIR